MQKRLVILSLMLSIVLILGCNNSQRASYMDENNQVVVTLGDKELKFESTKHISEPFRVLSLEPSRDRLEKSNGVTFTLSGIPSDKVSSNGTLSRSDINKREIFNIIPADEFVADQLSEISNRKGCWKSVSIVGDRVNKVSENGVASELDLWFFYLSSIDSSF